MSNNGPPFKIASIPQVLKELPQWVAWRYAERNGKTTKIPINPKTGHEAKSTDQTTWGSIQQAILAVEGFGCSGIGFVFSKDDSICGIDLDHCRDPETGVVEAWAKQIIERFPGCYCEVSPSGAGLHLFIEGKLPPGGRRKGAIEMYDQGRYFTVTGDSLNGCSSIAQRQAELTAFHRETFTQEEQNSEARRPVTPAEPLALDDAKLLEKARRANNGDRFSRLFDRGDTAEFASDDSRADQALCGMLAFWCQCDQERMDRLFRRSALYRKKWERPDYRSRTLKNAVASCRDVYTATASRGQNVEPRAQASRSNNERVETSVQKTQEITFTPRELLDAAHSGQDGDAKLFIAINKRRFCFDHAAGRWFRFEEHFWKEDFVEEALASVKDITILYAKEAKRLGKVQAEAAEGGQTPEANKAKKDREAFIKKISSLQKLAWKRSVLELAAAGKDSLGITGEEWDADPWALPCVNGVVDLKNGSFRPGRPEDFLKTVCPTEWKGLDQSAPAWEAFQRTITDDEELPNFKRRLFGSAIPGAVIERVFSMFNGPNGQNGKGTELETLHSVLGPLAGPIPAELLLKQDRVQNPDAPSATVMGLRGKRMVWASETERGRVFSTQRVKLLTGGDMLTGRDPYGHRQVEFSPSHSVFLITNNLPRVPSSDLAFWTRAVVVHFPFSFVDHPAGPYDRQKDPYLIDKLKTEASGILAWLVRGCLEWRKEGLNPPESVLEHKKDYRQAEDQLARFIEERCITGPTMEIQSNILFKVYQLWCAETGEKAFSVRTFGEEMKAKFDSYTRRNTFYVGVDLGKVE